MQSERLFLAIKGNGGKARLVILPYESHSYAAKENILHMLWEMDTWMEKWVKGKYFIANYCKASKTCNLVETLN